MTPFTLAARLQSESAYLMCFSVAHYALLAELQLAHKAAGRAVDAHGASVIHIDLSNDQIIDAGHHLPITHKFTHAPLHPYSCTLPACQETEDCLAGIYQVRPRMQCI